MIGFSQRRWVTLSREEENIAARRKQNRLWVSVPDAKGYESKQENYDVRSAGAERTEAGYDTPHFNVKKPKLERGAKQ